MARPTSGTRDASEEAEPCCSPVGGEQLNQEQAKRLARLLKAVADPSRLRLISAMVSSADSSACECELTGLLGLSQSTVSYHLDILLRAHLIEPDRGRVPGDRLNPGARCTYYRIDAEAVSAMARVLMPPRSTE